MAKNKRPPRAHQRPRQSEIPYALRLQANRFETIAAHRDDAAITIIQLACIALNDTEGLGYKRIARFAQRLQEIKDEYYADREVGDAHVERRLKQMGFAWRDGRMQIIVDDEGNLADKKFLRQKLAEAGIEEDI